MRQIWSQRLIMLELLDFSNGGVDDVVREKNMLKRVSFHDVTAVHNGSG